MISKIAKKIELKFWDVMIPLLSKATWLNKILSKLNILERDEDFIKQAAVVVVTACAGFACGFLLFSISTLFS